MATERSPLLQKALSDVLPTDEFSYQRGSYESIENIVEENGVAIDVRRFHSGELIYHCHAKEPKSEVDWQARKTLIMASILCLLFMLAEIIGGSLANSLAIITDAAHLLTDFASFLISLFSLYVATRPATKRMSFGWHRAEVLGAFTSVLLIWIVTGVLVYMAVERIINKTYDVNAKIMLITAAVGVSVNIIMGVLLHGGGGGGHGHSHGPKKPTDTVAIDPEEGHAHVERKPKRNINVRAAFIHVLGDFFQSVGVFIAALIIYFRPDLAIMDPICTFVFSVLVLVTTLAIMRDALNVLMEGSPHGVDFSEVAESLQSIPGVKKVHNLRIWALTLDKSIFSVHLAIPSSANSQEVLRAATQMLQMDYGVFESTIQIEGYSDAMEDCTKCEEPEK